MNTGETLIPIFLNDICVCIDGQKNKSEN